MEFFFLQKMKNIFRQILNLKEGDFKILVKRACFFKKIKNSFP